MEMKKKALCGLLSAAIFASVLAGCSNGGDGTNTAATDDPNEKLTIEWLSGPPGSNSSAQEGTEAELLLEERFNVDIKPLFYANENFNDRKTMLMAGGDIPDLIYELDPMYVQQDVDQGFLMNLPYEMIEQYAPTIYANINSEAPDAWLYSRVNDENYGLPNLIYTNAYARPVVWRTDWLQNVGIDKIPETLDEMHTALLAFTNDDPDGNGQKDTYGMSGDITNWHTTFTEIFGAYGVTPFNWMNIGDEVQYGGFQPGVTEALTLLQQWYSEGIIHPDFITDRVFQTGKDKFTNGIVGYMNQNGGYWDPDSSSSLINLVTQINPDATISNALPPKGPDGKSGTQVWGKPAHIVSFGVQNEEDPAKVIRILTMFETMMTDEELLAEVKMGNFGEEYTYKDESVGLGSGIQFLPPYDDSTQAGNACLTTDFGGPTFFAPFTPSFETFDKYRSDDVREVYETYFSEELGMPDAFNKPDVLPSAGEYFSDLRTKQINLMVEVITGEKSPDQYMTEFQEIWNAGGGPQLETEASEMKDTLNTIYQEIGVTVTE